MDRIWIDILTPKQALFFKPLIDRLDETGHQMLITTREYPQATEMIQRLGIPAQKLGRHGGFGLAEKLYADAQRILELIRPVTAFNPSIAVSFVSPTATRVAFGLAIPMICVSDSPHAHAVSRLTIPLTTYLLSPDMIDKAFWLPFGIRKDQIIQYHAFDQMAWIQSFKPSVLVLEELGLSSKRPIVTVRLEEAFAAYLMNRTEQDKSPVIPIVNHLHDNFPDTQIVVLPRYPSQAVMLERVLPESIIIPKHVIDGPSLLFFSTLFIGAGGTMTTEAVLLGVPAISFFEGELEVERWLLKRGMLYRGTTPEEIIGIATKILSEPNKAIEQARRIARSLREEFEDPIAIIFDCIMRVLSKKD
ncbi:MAG: DUF354 domain-containing protein [Candidatus Ranarchaeia archaeon]